MMLHLSGAGSLWVVISYQYSSTSWSWVSGREVDRAAVEGFADEKANACIPRAPHQPK